MNKEVPADAPKKSIISIPFIIVVVILIAGGYPAGKWVMTKYMTMEETNKFSGAAIPPEEDVNRDGESNEMAEQTNTVGGGGGLRGRSFPQDEANNSSGGFDADAVFAERDKDSNGKLEGEEISQRMKGRMDSVDSDGDGAINKEEFVEAMKSRGS